MLILAHDILTVLSQPRVQLFLAALLLPPAVGYSLGGLVWRKRPYWRNRLWAPIAYYGILAALLAVDIYCYLHYAILLERIAFVTVWWVFAGPLVGLGMFVPVRSPREAGLCPKCGYDLRAHEPGERCPECGTSIRDPGLLSGRVKSPGGAGG